LPISTGPGPNSGNRRFLKQKYGFLYCRA
jgi:hypothetical protein